jgi:hypothetical protein
MPRHEWNFSIPFYSCCHADKQHTHALHMDLSYLAHSAQLLGGIDRTVDFVLKNKADGIRGIIA